MPLHCTLRKVIFILCPFYHNKENKTITLSKVTRIYLSNSFLINFCVWCHRGIQPCAVSTPFVENFTVVFLVHYYIIYHSLLGIDVICACVCPPVDHELIDYLYKILSSSPHTALRYTQMLHIVDCQ